ncbi:MULTISPECIES: DUF29 family protein [Pseudanabaena]|nr:MULTISPECIES: DUF29 family protein [Pseudanabaena]MEA5488807.1 DUF29 family protein [Pseudanabaena sp. CCNP1317]WGS71237.1 DUF29 family protein [Pseudanabaena galeata CCNP1313]
MRNLENCGMDYIRKLASVETGLAIATFPMESPFTSEQTLDEDFLPED